MMIELVVRGTLGLLWLAVIVLASKWPDGRSGPDAERRHPIPPLARRVAPSGPERSSAISVLGQYELAYAAKRTDRFLAHASEMLEHAA